MTEEQKEWGVAVNCKVIMECDCDVILKDSKCDLKKKSGKVFLQKREIPKPLHFSSAILTCNAIHPEL